ncbi:MAG: porin family protein [Bacteroidales bacterium]|nr:porin family protein [Bacteroidales bacterium]
MELRDKRHTINLIISWNTIFLLILIICLQVSAFGQYNRPHPIMENLLKNWSVSLNLGQTSFFGDVSLYDNEISEKITKEGSFGYGFMLSRQMTPVIGLSGQLLFGQLRGENSKTHFEANIIEYTINATLNIVNLLLPENDANFFLYGKLGMGQYKFNSRLVYNDPLTEDKIVDTNVPEFLILFGGGAYYKISYSFDVNAEIAGRIASNDKIDGTVNKKDKDYYSYMSIGITYKINNVRKTKRKLKRMGAKFPFIKRR